jgi:AAA+ superfamily predicted ATPase
MSTKNNNHSIQGKLVLSWIVLILVAVLIFTQSLTWGIIFTAITIVVKIVTRKKKVLTIDNPESVEEIKLTVTAQLEKPDAKSNNKDNHHENNNQNNYISKDYFINITQEVEKIISLYSQLCNDSYFLQLFNKNTYCNIEIDGRESTAKEKTKTLFLIDMTKCFVDLGHELDFKSKVGFGLFYFFARTNGLEKFDYENLNIVLNHDFSKSISDVAAQIRNAIDTNQTIDDIFLISNMLGDYDTDQRQKYLIMLYRYASLTAKADGRVSETEAEWLSKILNLSQKTPSNSNVVISNKEEQQAKLPVKHTKQPAKPGTTQLKSLIGLESVKEEIETLTNFIKIQQTRESKGLKTSSVSYHCVFTGNPGTGKTTVARIVADIYKNLGILGKGHLVETDRSGLVAEYVGQTAAKTNKIIDTALDGVLFIDEAYSLISKNDNDYGKEAIATLLKRMEDNRDRLIVILAGYSKEMQDFIDSNPGLQSRFNRYIEFPDYSAEELFQVFKMNAKQFDYKIAKEAKMPLKEYFAKRVANKDKNFGNARFVRNLFEKTIERQANRLSQEVDLTKEKLSEISPIDIPM